MKQPDSRRRGFSLLELVVAMTMMAALTAASVVLIRTSQSAWNRHRSDYQRRNAAAATLRHITRQVRQATAVAAISGPTDNSGELTIHWFDGSMRVWDHDDSTDKVWYGVSTASELLAENITALTFTGLKADGTTPTVEAGLIHSVRCELEFEVDRSTGTATERIATEAWIRSW